MPRVSPADKGQPTGATSGREGLEELGMKITSFCYVACAISEAILLAGLDLFHFTRSSWRSSIARAGRWKRSWGLENWSE